MQLRHALADGRGQREPAGDPQHGRLVARHVGGADVVERTVWSRPRRFAAYSARSARSTRALPDSTCSLVKATPADERIVSGAPAALIGAARMLSRIRSAVAVSISMSATDGTRTMNSSPPQRPGLLPRRQRGGDPLRGFGQHGVAGVVAVDVVDLLEVVDVEQDHAGSGGHRRLVGRIDGRGDPLADPPTIREARERIGLRETLELVRGAHAVGHVVVGADVAHHATVLVVHRCTPARDPHLAAVLLAQPERRLVDSAGPHRLAPQLERRRAIVRVHRVGPPIVEGLLAVHAVDLLPAIVRVDDGAVRVGGVDTDRRRRGQRAEPLLRRSARGLDGAHRRDVGDDARDDGDAVAPCRAVPAVEDAHDRAVLVREAILARATAPLGLSRRDGVVEVPVVGMYPPAPEVLVRDAVVLVEPEEALGRDALGDRVRRAVRVVLPDVDVVVDLVQHRLEPPRPLQRGDERGVAAQVDEAHLGAAVDGPRGKAHPRPHVVGLFECEHRLVHRRAGGDREYRGMRLGRHRRPVGKPQSERCPARHEVVCGRAEQRSRGGVDLQQALLGIDLDHRGLRLAAVAAGALLVVGHFSRYRQQCRTTKATATV